MRTVLRAIVVLLTAVALIATLALPASAHSHRVTSREPVFGGLTHERFSVQVGSGTARGDILRFRADHSYLRLDAALSRDRVAGLETTAALSRRELPNNALAGINGGFFHMRSFLPGGAPNGASNGFTVHGGQLVGGRSQVTASGGPIVRGHVGIRPSGALAMDWIDRTRVEIRHGDGEWVDITWMGSHHDAAEINLQPRISGERPAANEIIFYDRNFGAPVQVPAGSRVIVVEGLQLLPGGVASGVVRSAGTVSSRREMTVEAGTTLVLAHGTTALSRVSSFVPGDTLSVRTTPRRNDMRAENPTLHPIAWGDLVASVPGSPLLMRNGHRTSDRMWRDEHWRGDEGTRFLWNRHPRTAIGRTSLGEILLVTVDGRNSGWSQGMTIPELQSFMHGLGAVDALNLDGGGSTTMTIGGSIVNRPSETGRSVANGLFVYHSYPFDGTRRISGSDRFSTAAQVATRTYPDGADRVVIATGSGFPDALAGGPRASQLGAPLLLTRRGELPDATLQALDALRPRSAVLLGGTGAINNDVREALRARGIGVTRVHGLDRYSTAAEIARTMVGPADVERVFVATGGGFADALSAAAPAGMMGAPILLTRKGELPDETRRFITERRVGEVVIVGGTGAVSNVVRDRIASLDSAMNVRRLHGPTRYATAKAVNDWAASRVPTHDETGLIVANGSNFPDALAGGPRAAAESHLLMIVPPRDVNANEHAKAYLDARGAGPLARITLIGGRGVLSDYQRWQLDQVAIR